MTAVKYWRENASTHVKQEAALHEGDGTIVRRLFFREQSRLPVRFDIWELPPGASEGDHTHAGDDTLEEIYYFMAGQGEMRFGDEAVRVAPGDAVLVPPGVDHGLYNTGSETLKLLILWGRPAA